MRLRAFIAWLLCVAMLTGCMTSTVEIPTSEALTKGFPEREYWITPVPKEKETVFLRQPQRREVVRAYPESVVGLAPYKDLERVVPLKWPVTFEERDGFLILKSRTGDFIAPLASVGALQITQPSTGKKVALITALAVPAAVVGAAIVIVIGLVVVLVIVGATGNLHWGAPGG